MSKIKIHDPVADRVYTLEFTRKSIEVMEKQGFVVEEVAKKPVTYLPTLFAGAFYVHHRFMKREDIDKIYERMTKKEQLISKLVEMYNESVVTLLDDPAEGKEGNLDWTAE